MATAAVDTTTTTTTPHRARVALVETRRPDDFSNSEVQLQCDVDTLHVDVRPIGVVYWKSGDNVQHQYRIYADPRYVHIRLPSVEDPHIRFDRVDTVDRHFLLSRVCHSTTETYLTSGILEIGHGSFYCSDFRNY